MRVINALLKSAGFYLVPASTVNEIQDLKKSVKNLEFELFVAEAYIERIEDLYLIN